MRSGTQNENFFNDQEAVNGYIKNKFRFRALSSHACVKNADLPPRPYTFFSIGGGPGSDVIGALMVGGGKGLVYDYAEGWKESVERLSSCCEEYDVSWGGCVDVRERDLRGLEGLILENENCVVLFHYVLCEVMLLCKGTEEEDGWMNLVLALVEGGKMGTIILVQDQVRENRGCERICAN